MTHESAALLDSVNPAAGTVFEDAGFAVIQYPKSLDTAGLTNLASTNDVLGVRSGPKLPEAIFDGSESRLQAVGVFGVGTNHIAMPAANRAAVAVFNSVHENTRSVAEHVIGSVFDLMKRTSEHNRSLHVDGAWSKTDEKTYEIRGKVLGIIGYGTVGSQVSVLAEALGMSVKYFDPAPKLAPYGNAERVDDLESLLAISDVVTLHVPGIPATKKMINERTLALMKPGSFLINTARGEVVDYDAVAGALESGQLAGVSVDVYDDDNYKEPAKQGDRFDHVLRGIPNAVLTPHTAGSTIEAQTEIGLQTATKLAGYIATGNSIGSVNFPELALAAVVDGQTRILHVHDNVVGVEADILSRLAEHELNVASNSLNTRGSLGYAAINVEGLVPAELLQEIGAVRHTLRVRTIPNL